MKRRAVMVLLAATACLGGGAAVAQDKPADNLEVLREKVRADKKLLVATSLELTEKEAKGFWPVYGAYQSDMIAYHDRIVKLVSDYAKAYNSMDDATATQLLGDFLANEAEYNALLVRYLPRFEKVLPPKKVARFYQLENKLRAMLNYELAQQIPLVK